MNVPRSLSIRAHLALLVVAAIAPAVLVAAGLLVFEQRNEAERLDRDSIATARAMVHAIDREIVNLTAAAQVLATSQRLQSGDIEAFRAQAERVAALHIGTNVVVSGADGRQLLNTLRAPGAPLAMHGNPGQLRKVFATERPVVSDLYVGGVLGRPVMSVDVPVVRDGKVVYDLSIGEVPERFLAILQEQKLPAGWIGAVFDGEGKIVARTREQDRWLGKPGAAYLLEAIARQPEGAPEGSTLEGIRVLSPYSRSPVTGWTVALGIPRSEIAAKVWQRSLLYAAAAGMVLLLGLALAWGIGGNIAAAVRGLERPASELGRRDEIEVPRLGVREADEVGQALVRAARMIALAQHRAQHDPLTGLANRTLFREITAHAVETCKRDGSPLSVLFIDLDRFKQVNDNHGHETGDRLLVAVAGRLRAGARSSDVVARVGGDEFAVMLEGADADTGALIAFKLRDDLARPYPIDGLTLEVRASIGSATYPQSGSNADELLRRADEAMYRMKQARRAV